MVSIKHKTINGRKYLYAEHSFRLPNGKIKKISKLIQNKGEEKNKGIKDYFLKKQIESYQDYALETYKPNSILNEEQIKKLEQIKVEYKEIIRSFIRCIVGQAGRIIVRPF